MIKATTLDGIARPFGDSRQGGAVATMKRSDIVQFTAAAAYMVFLVVGPAILY